MVSNTKLFPEQKQFVKEYCKDNKDVLFYSNERVTIMVKPEFKGSRMVAVSFSTMSPDEKKYRKSVGKYYTISNFENGQYVLMDWTTFYNIVNQGEGYWSM